MIHFWSLIYCFCKELKNIFFLIQLLWLIDPRCQGSNISTGFVARVTRNVLLVEQELFTIPEHLGSSPVFSGVHGTPSLGFCVMFCKSLFVLFFSFSLVHCDVCPSSVYVFWLPLWYLKMFPYTSHGENKLANTTAGKIVALDWVLEWIIWFLKVKKWV